VSFTTADAALLFMFAGHAIVTLESRKTGTHFTYRISAAPEGQPHFVSLLTGADNGSDYEFFGTIFNELDFRHGKRARIGREAPGVRAFVWAWDRLSHGEIPEDLVIHHEGRCGKCGRPLTVPESIESGIGPVCAGR
jgi:hypothetical protein